jgi:hypothetical protein
MRVLTSNTAGSAVADGAETLTQTRRAENKAPENLISVSSFRTLWRACTVRDEARLTAAESASTLFRFFRSRHVVDLKLIATLVIVVALFHLFFVVLFPIARSLLHLYASPNAYGGTLGLIAHCLRLAFPAAVKYFFPAVPLYGVLMAWTYLTAATRLGVVDLFACEITTLCRVGTVFDIGKRYVVTYRSNSAAEEKHAVIKHLAAKAAEEKTADSFVSQEEYFPIFDNNSSDLQTLEALVVAHITEFYTYMKATRAVQRKLASTKPSHPAVVGDQTSAPIKTSPNSTSDVKTSDEPARLDLWHETLANLIYVLFLGYESARKSVADLIEFQPTRAEDTIVILLTELECFAFLCDYFKADDLRYNRLQLREEDYRQIVPDLINKAKAPHIGNEEYWAPAEQTIPELEDRFKTVLETLTRCVSYREACKSNKASSSGYETTSSNPPRGHAA